jgi:hypothetical protein
MNLNDEIPYLIPLNGSEEPEDPDDDGDDDEEPADGESFDGGFGPGSYFSHAMRKDD